MVINLRSKRLTALFSEVWNNLPKKDRDSISGRTLLIVDNPIFLPKNHHPVWGAVIVAHCRKSISILYLSPRKLPQQRDSFVRYVIAHEFGHLRRGHAEKLFTLTEDKIIEDRFEREANLLARRWGFPKCKPG